jgi:hypothetical protein
LNDNQNWLDSGSASKASTFPFFNVSVIGPINTRRRRKDWLSARKRACVVSGGPIGPPVISSALLIVLIRGANEGAELVRPFATRTVRKCHSKLVTSGLSKEVKSKVWQRDPKAEQAFP